MDVKSINARLKELSKGGVLLPSSTARFQRYFSDIVTPEGLFKDVKDTKYTQPEYERLVDAIFHTFPEDIDPDIIQEGKVKKMVQMILNYNSTVPSSEQIDLNSLSNEQISHAAIHAERALATTNIYRSEFGRSLKEALRDATEDVRGS